MAGQSAQQSATPPLNEENAMKSLNSAKSISVLALAIGALVFPAAGFAATTWNSDIQCTTGGIVSSCGATDPTLFGASNASSGMAAGGAGNAKFAAASVYDWGTAGLGVVNPFESASDTGPHAIDNKYGTDAIFLKFSGLVNLSGLSIGFNGTDNCSSSIGGCVNSGYNDSDLSVFAWVGGSSAALAAPDITKIGPVGLTTTATSGWQLIGNYADVGGNTGNAQALTSTIFSSYWLVSAYNTNYGATNSNSRAGSALDNNFNDQFKLLTVTYDSKVPEPSGLALLALALLALFATRRNWSARRSMLSSRA